MHSPPSHVIFDLDGTLVDSSIGILGSFRATLDEIDLSAEDHVLRQLIGPPLNESFRRLGVREEGVAGAVELYREFYADRGVFEATLYPGVAATLESLSDRGIHLGVATAKRVDFAHQMLTALGVAHLFEEISGASIDLRLTSKFDIMRQVIESWNSVRGLDVWMVGDRRYDMVAARDHHVRAVGALWGFGSAEELCEAGAQWLVHRPVDLVEREPDGGSSACMIDEVCDVCGSMLDTSHPELCPGPTVG